MITVLKINIERFDGIKIEIEISQNSYEIFNNGNNFVDRSR